MTASDAEIWRGINAAVAVLAFSMGGFRLHKHWNMLGMGRLVVMALLMFEVATIYGSIEQIFQHTPGGFRIFLGLIANFWAVIAFLHRPTGADDA